MLLFVKFRQALTLKSVCIQFAPKMDAVLCMKEKKAKDSVTKIYLGSCVELLMEGSEKNLPAQVFSTPSTM